MGSPPKGRRRQDERGVIVYGMLLDGSSIHENEKSNQLQGTGAISTRKLTPICPGRKDSALGHDASPGVRW